jgi:hypothetical protein
MNVPGYELRPPRGPKDDMPGFQGLRTARHADEGGISAFIDTERPEPKIRHKLGMTPSW